MSDQDRITELEDELALQKALLADILADFDTFLSNIQALLIKYVKQD